MKEKNNCGTDHRIGSKCGDKKRAPSSMWCQDPDLIFNELDLQQGDVFLDLGCGAGDYALMAAGFTGDFGMVYALDRERDFVDRTLLRAKDMGFAAFKGLVSDITDPIPLEDETVDVCFVCTVLHAVDTSLHGENIFNEMGRVLKKGGQAAVVECKKEKTDFGPPLNLRLSEKELEEMAKSAGLKKVLTVDLGFNYLIKFKKT